MKPDHTVRVVIETDTQCVEKRAYADPDFPDIDLTSDMIAEAIIALDFPRRCCFLASIVREICERGRLDASNICDKAAEERFLDAAYEVVTAWNKMDEKYGRSGSGTTP